MDVLTKIIGHNKGTFRVWLEGRLLNKAGFEPKTRYQIKTEQGAIILTKDEVGFRIVSSRIRADKYIPIIDINSAELLAQFDGLTHVKVVFGNGEIRIEQLASDVRAKERLERTQTKIKNGEALSFTSLFHGGGVMSEALHEGFTQSGVNSRLDVVSELREEMLDQAAISNDSWSENTISLCGKMQELAFDPQIMQKLPQCDLLSAGIACSGASVAGRVKRKLAHPEAHPEVGHLVVSLLALIMRINPTVCIFECVVPYLNSASMDLLRNQLTDMHYELQETVIDSTDWNALEKRKRMFVVAVTKGVNFSFADVMQPEKIVRTLSEILEPMEHDDPRWKTMQGLKDKEVRDAEAGKSFAMQIFDENSSHITTLTKGIQRNRSTDAKIRHPGNDALLRIPTALEHVRAKGISEKFIAGLCEGFAHELAGQSVVWDVVVSLGAAVANSLKNIRAACRAGDELPLFALA